MDRAQPTAEPAPRVEVFPRAALDRSIPERFEEIARRHAHRPAVRCGGEAITYGALDRAASRAAAGIRARGDVAGAPIVLLLERDIPQVVATFAVLKARRIYVPLDAAFPEDRLRVAVADARPAALIVDAATAGLAARVAPSSVPVLPLSELDAEPPATPPSAAGALASITYTSGSTGAPKGIVQSHENLLHDVLVRANHLQLHPADRVGGLSSLAFSAGAKSVLLALLNGATFCMFDPRADGLHTLAPWLAREGVTILDSVASAFRHFAGALTGSERFPALRMIWTSSEHVTAHDVRLYRRHFPPETGMVIRYSASEAGVICQLRVDRESPVGDDFSDVGYPVPDKELLLLDDAGRPVPAGEVGEVVIRSRYLAVGYWRQPELTARAFAPDPAGGPARVYRTGDLGRLRPDGCLQHLGRKDFQAKVRGQRVDLGVLEQALFAAPGVKEAAVVVREDRPGDQRLVAYVVPAESPGPGEAALRQALGARFPYGPVPAAYVSLAALPRTPTGKVDLRGLPAPGGDRGGVRVEAARDATEARLIELWEEVLDVRPIGARDNFFALGGHSLLAARLLAEIADRFERRLPMATIFRAPTIDRLAAVLRGESPPEGESLLVPIARGESGSLPIFCVHEHTGELFCYLALARHLGPDQPVWGLVPRGLDGGAAPLRTMEALGAAYVDEIRRVQPRGPYALVGYCFGGIVAFEMARQFTAAGDDVRLLALLEPPREGGRAPVRRAFRRARRRVAFEWSRLRARSGAARVGYALGRAVVLARDQADRARRARAAWRMDRGGETLLERAVREVTAANGEALRRYTPGVYPGRLTLFRPPELPARFHGDPHLGWAGLAAGGIAIEQIPGRYRAIIEDEPARRVAERIRFHLAAEADEARRGAATGAPR